MAELKAAEVELKRHMQVLERLATIDALTNIANRHGFLTRAAEEIARSRRHARPLGLVMFDLDHFKRVNDDWGHAVGDEVLRQIAAAVDASIRPEDFLARIGGEEFVVLLPGTDRAAALRAAGRLRQTVEATEIRHDGGTLRITASFGTSVLAPEDGSIDALLSRADNALYRAKEGGRNQVRTEFPG